MQYATGQIQYAETDLASDAFGIAWGHSRSYANVLSNNGTGINGNSWLVKQMKRLSFIDVSYGSNNPLQICVVDSASSSLWLKRTATTPLTYASQFRGFEVMKHDAVKHQFVLTSSTGLQMVFHDNTTATPRQMTGRLKSIIDKSGRTVTLNYDTTTGSIKSLEQSESGQTSGYYYTYITAVTNKGKLASVTLKVNGREVRRARYTYYASGTGGTLGDLKAVSVDQYDQGLSDWKTITNKHYRYYVTGEAHGFQFGLKYVIQGLAYQRMVDSGLNPQTATSVEIANFADYYFEYDSQHRVTLERVEGGRKQYAFAYTANPAVPGLNAVNVWAMRTVETLPDGNQNRIYTNKAGQVMLKIFRAVASSRQWYSYNEFTDDYALKLNASSAAVQSVSEPGATGFGAFAVVLKSQAGLIREQLFYTSDNPTTGAVSGYLERKTVKQGSNGTRITLMKQEYTSRTAYGQTVHPLRARIVYPTGSSGSSDGSRTEFSYTWYNDAANQPSFQIKEKTTKHPAVSAAQNGSAVSGVGKEVLDIYGKTIWQKDTRGAIAALSYDLATGALVQRIADVDTAKTSGVPTGWSTVAGWGLHLITDYIVDSLGRTTQERGPWHEVQLKEADTSATSIRTVEFTAFVDEAHEVRRATGYMTGDDPTADFHTIGAVQLTRSDESGSVVDTIQATRGCNCGALNTSETFPQQRWTRWTHHVFDTWGRLFANRIYHRIPERGEGREIVDYLETIFGYDSMGRRSRIVEASGTIQRSVYDPRGLVISRWTGTNDIGATDADPAGGGAAGNNMKRVAVFEYDGGAAGGNGNLTKQTLPVNDTATNDRVTLFAYDFRDRLETTTQTDSTRTWLTKSTFDNEDRITQSTTYKTSATVANRLAQSRTLFDALGRVYRELTDGVDPANGNITGTLTTQRWFDLGSNVIKEAAAGRTAFTKTVFDALNRPTVSYLACRPGTAGVPSGDDNNVTTDTVLEQTAVLYDRGGNVTSTTRAQRFDDATGTGVLKGPLTEPKSRNNYAMTWPDAIGRVRVSADYGTNGGSVPTRPAVAPARSDTILVTTNRHKDSGDANATIDPMGLETRWDNDQAGRRVRTIENYVAGNEDNSRISEFVWHPSGQLERLTLVNSVTGDQVTRWLFGTTLADSAVASNNLLRTKIYPESDDRPAPASDGADGVYARLEYTYNRQGQPLSFKDADQTVHEYVYDKLSRTTEDRATALGAGLDATVRRLGRTYDVRGYVDKVTSYSAITGGTVLNEVQFVYDAFGNLIEDRQSHAGAVTGTTPKVVYGYTNGSTNIMRKVSVTYPNGRVLNYHYGTTNSIDDHLNRVTDEQVTGESAHLVDYRYVGDAWQSRISYPQPSIMCDYKKQSGEPDGDAGDPYTGYDRFGRTVDIRWIKPITG